MLRNLLSSGKEITIPEREVTIGGWTGTGYEVINPEDGSGAYMIDGGLAGGVWIELASVLLSIILATLILALIGTSLTLAAIPLGVLLPKILTERIITALLPKTSRRPSRSG